MIGALPIDDAVRAGRVTFIGAVGDAPVREDGAIEIVPVQLELVEAARQMTRRTAPILAAQA